MFCSKNRALNLQEIKVFKKHCQSISWVFFLLYILNQGRRLNGAKYAFRFSVKLLHFYLSIANLSVSNGQLSLLLAFRPTIPNSWTKSVELLTNVQKERNHKLYNMKPQVLPGKSAHTRVRGGLRPKLCHGQPLMSLVSFIYLWLHISGYKQMADLNEQERCAPYLDEPRQEEEREGFVHHVYIFFESMCRGVFMLQMSTLLLWEQCWSSVKTLRLCVKLHWIAHKICLFWWKTIILQIKTHHFLIFHQLTVGREGYYLLQNSMSHQNILSSISRNGDCVRMLISDWSTPEVQAPPIPPSLL